MKTVALAAPLVVLGLLPVLQKLESWTVGGAHRQESAPPAQRRQDAVTSRRGRGVASHG